MELYFLALLVILMAVALASGYPVAFALPGSAILSIMIAAGAGWLFASDVNAYFHQGGPSQWLSAGVTNLRGVYWEVERDTLIAIPLFIFMGIMLQRSKIAEDLLLTMAQLFGPVRGGLGISVVFVGALLAATTGILGATVVAMGLISLPAMLRNNYSVPLATGTIAASGTLGQIIPPSIVLIILADQLASAVDQAGTMRQALYKQATGQLSMPSEFGVASTSAGEMFLGAFVPGLVLVCLYMLFILVLAFVRPSVAPSVPREGAMDKAFLINVVLTLVPPLTLIFLVLGSIIAGIATVNQAGAIGAAGAMLMAGYRLYEGKRSRFYPAIIAMVALVIIAYVLANYDTNIKNINSDADRLGVNLALGAVAALVIALIWSGWRAYRIDNTLYEVMVETAKTTSLVFIILLGAAMLTAAFRAFGGEDIVREFLNSLPGGFWSQFIIVMAVIFFLGFFLDFIEIAVVVVPIVAPILLADPGANVTAVWLGVMIGLNIQTSFLTPPFGFALFYLRGVAPAVVKTIDIYKGVIPFIFLQLVALTIVGYTPQLVNYLPNRVSFTSVTAPPPRNPKLQYCLEEYAAQQYDQNGSAISSAIETAKALDTTYLPKSIQSQLTSMLTAAEKTPGLLAEARSKADAVEAGAAQYRPLHSQVRLIEKDVGKLKLRIDTLETDASRLYGDDNATAKDKLLERAAALKERQQSLLDGIPGQWAEADKTFSVLRKDERIARLGYRRSADSSYEPVASMLELFNDTDSLREMEKELQDLRAKVEQGEPAATADDVKDLTNRIGKIKGASDIRSALYTGGRELSGRTPDKEKALAQIDKAITAFNAQMTWRNRAAKELVPGLQTYAAATKDTFGLRLQTNMTREQALFVASCSAGHRNLSLNF
ncbi:MAG: TRAP transporter large permease subunit [Burkholderiaceae bacterium]